MTSTPTEIDTAFPVEVDDRVVELLRFEEDEAHVVVHARVSTKEDGIVVDVVEQEFPLKRSATPSALAANVRFHLGRDVYATPQQLFEPPAHFQKLPADTDLHLGTLGARLSEQACATGFDLRYFVAEQWPEPPRIAFYAHSLYAMAGGNGFETYLSQNEPEELAGVLEALETLATPRLLRHFREALGLARALGSEVVSLLDEAWLDENALPPPASPAANENPWSTIDTHDEDGTYGLIARELVPAARAHAEAHRAELVADREPRE